MRIVDAVYVPRTGERGCPRKIAMTAKKNILVVDDERDILDLIQYNLSKEGYSVTTALNGRKRWIRQTRRPTL